MSEQHNEQVIAGWWRRFFAVWYELLLLVALVLVWQAIWQAGFQWLSGLPITALAELPWARNLSFAALLGFIFAYFAFCWRRGQTLAMKTWRMQLQNYRGGTPGYVVITLRFIAATVFYGPAVPLWVLAWHDSSWIAWAWLSTAWLIAPYAWVIFDRDRQLLHDRLAGTRLVMKQKKPN